MKQIVNLVLVLGVMASFNSYAANSSSAVDADAHLDEFLPPEITIADEETDPSFLELTTVDPRLGSGGIVINDPSMGIPLPAPSGTVGAEPAPGAPDLGLGENPTDPFVIIDKIINLGKQVWAIIEAGKPVLNTEMNSATALPGGIEHFSQLQNWKPTKTKSYKIVQKAAAGNQLIRIGLKVRWGWGGDFKGKGQYIRMARVDLDDTFVSWMRTLDVKVEAPAVFNMGKSEDPIGAIDFKVSWAISTPFTKNVYSTSFTVRGDGQFIDDDLQKLR